MRKIYYWAYIVWLSFLRVFETNLGNWVWYKNERWQVVNGATVGRWDLQKVRYGERVSAPRDECILVMRPSNFIHSFRSSYRFYMTSWFSIWVQNGIEPWVLGCRIWPKLFYRPKKRKDNE